MRVRGILSGLALALAGVLLSACAGMPTSGPVTVGRGTGDVDQSLDLSFNPQGPQKGASPTEIVEGFLLAGTSPDGNWKVARQFLAGDAAKKWNPAAGVTVDDLVGRSVRPVSDTSITVTVDAVGAVDKTGAYALAQGPIPLPFTLAKQDDGQWRITEAQDGIVLDSDFFPRVYSPYSLMYFDPTWTYLVPDVRWFPARQNVPTQIVTQLLDGTPSPWLAGSVATAFPAEITTLGSVPVSSDNVAQVEVPNAALSLPQTQVDRMQAQLEASLASAGVTDAVMTVGSVDVAATPAVTRSTRVESAPAVLTDGGFGFLTGDELQPIPGISPGMKRLAPVAVELSPDRDVAAVRVASGAVVRLRANGQNTSVDTRSGLIDPTVDGEGHIWSVPAAHPSELVAIAADGASAPVADAWRDASRISAMELSRDGTRIAAVVTTGGRTELWVAGVIRRDGVPTHLGDPVVLAVLPGTGVDVAWLDDSTVGAVSRVGSDVTVLTQQVGGLGTASHAPDGVTAIAGSAQASAVRLVAKDGTLYIRTGTRWQKSATGVHVLATQQGAPR